MTKSAMTKNLAKGDAKLVASERSMRMAARDEDAVVPNDHSRSVCSREPLHARIVHFDAERSSVPRASNKED